MIASLGDDARELVRVAEEYVRPPLAGWEAPSARAAAWRFWLGFAVLLAAVIVGLFLLYRFATGGAGEGDPGLNPNALASSAQVR